MANEIQLANSLRKQEELRLAWVMAIKKYNKAADEVRNLIQENQQVTTFKSLNPFLFATDLGAAAEAADLPAVTMSEAAHISQDPYPGPAARQLRERKLAERQLKTPSNVSPNTFIQKVNTDVPMR